MRSIGDKKNKTSFVRANCLLPLIGWPIYDTPRSSLIGHIITTSSGRKINSRCDWTRCPSGCRICKKRRRLYQSPQGAVRHVLVTVRSEHQAAVQLNGSGKSLKRRLAFTVARNWTTRLRWVQSSRRKRLDPGKRNDSARLRLFPGREPVCSVCASAQPRWADRVETKSCSPAKETSNSRILSKLTVHTGVVNSSHIETFE